VYNLRSPARDELLRHLAAAGVSCGIHYPTPIHLQPAYAHLGLPASSFPAAERFCAESLSLPLHPCLGSAELSYIAEAVHTWARAIGCVQARVA
jgi:dTDP-4-amino-4,6-dideoxygalactose transaminase